MTVGELRRVLEPLTDEAEVLLPAYEHPKYGSYRKTTRACIEAVVQQDGVFARMERLAGQAEAALVIR